ncbi:MAG TPA: type II toxin-antitoxin system RelE/ParE family toxin [Acetobacteraceae bacterium]|nr:type II toxin-antitoxin system RelE/ParE family toxin [Acetobacteraceae bacterium]
MTAPAVLTLRARRELGAALRRIASDNPDAADRFYEAVRKAAHWIGGNPALGAHRPSLAGHRYRFWSIPRYRYVLVYTDATDPPRIVRIVHTSRDLPNVLADLLR